MLSDVTTMSHSCFGTFYGGVKRGFHLFPVTPVGILRADGLGDIVREDIFHDAQLFRRAKMSGLDGQLPLRLLALTKFKVGIEKRDQRTDGQVAGAGLFEEKLEIERTGRRFGHDQDEKVALEKDLAGEVVMRDMFEVTAFFFGEEGVIEGGGFTGHLNSFHEMNPDRNRGGNGKHRNDPRRRGQDQ